MGHAIQAIVLAPGVAIRDPEPSHLVTVALPQGFALVPLTDELFDELRTLYPSEEPDPHAEFWKLSAPVLRFVLRLSRGGAVAYLETEYSGGAGEQAAASWRAGSAAVHPRRADVGPINEALRSLGAQAGDARDEFEALGLQRFRDLDALLDAGAS